MQQSNLSMKLNWFVVPKIRWTVYQIFETYSTILRSDKSLLDPQDTIYHLYFFYSYFILCLLLVLIITISISSNVIGALTALFFTNCAIES